MSERDGFTSGFLLGSIIGGVVGGLMGAIITTAQTKKTEESEASLLNSSNSEVKPVKTKKRHFKDSESMEFARQSLDDKIAQLNSAIDEVRLSLGTVNGTAKEAERGQSLDS